METLFIGKNLHFLHEVESTNTYAMDLLRNVNAIEGTIVYTDNQTKGRGQRGSVWNAEIASNITASVILKPKFLSIDKSFYLSKISALAMYDLLSEILPNSQYDIKIKWPNDILVNRKKIAGILIENSFNNQFIQNSVIGIGLNVNQVDFNELNTTAISLRIIAQHEFNRNDLLMKIAGYLEKWYLILKQQKFELINQHYSDCLFALNTQMKFNDELMNFFNATVKGVEEDGKLKLELESGICRLFEVKEVKMHL